MDLFISIIFGALQGLTEFLPISSSAHTLIIYSFINNDFIDIITLQVILHFGTLMAVIFYFRKSIFIYIKGFLNGLKLKKTEKSFKNNALIYLFIATIPLGIIGFYFENIIEYYLHNTIVIPFSLIIGGILFIISEKYSKQNIDVDNINLKKAFLIGTSQIIALIPGVSRSGITIITGLFLNLKRKAAAEFTFLLSIPTIAGITLKKFLDLTYTDFTNKQLIFYILAFVSSMVIGFLCIKYLLKFLANNSLKIFAYYRFILAIIIILIFHIF